ncbi:MAG: tRNA pseudouridine(38-40) synthase TruA [Lachnospiraceae bacterium]|nr:tRNA pseudouridine(38-40) synthase TruA [Lachnospiraceae bacterium]
MNGEGKRVLLRVAYDGTAYHGWQRQQNGMTVQQVLEETLTELLQEKTIVTGASRTDAGVHALCNAAVFDTHARIPGEKICYAVNQRLPQDIRAVASREVSLDFDLKKSRTHKTYEYRIVNAPFPNPVKRLYSHFTYVPCNVERMRTASGYLVGEHDFRAFCTVGAQVETTIRRVTDISATREGEDITIAVSGNGFLYNMVRIIAGTLLEVGYGRMEPERVEEILVSKERKNAGPTAPACGLCLTRLQIEGIQDLYG